MNLSSFVPKSLRHLKPKEKRTALVVGGVAAVGVLYLLHRKSATSPQAPASRISVQGVWTDLANKLGVPIGADMDIRTAQTYLNQVANAGLSVDGILSTKTSAALRKFQLGNGLPQTGVIDEETGNALQYMAAATSKNPLVQKTVTAKPGTFGGGYWADLVSKNPKLGPPFSSTLKMSIKGAQRALNDILHAAIPMTGRMDAQTMSQVRAFQAEQGLPQTGHLNAETSNALLYMATAANPTLTPPVYHPEAMPQMPQQQASPYGAPPALTQAHMQAQQAQLAQGSGAPIDIGNDWQLIGNCACHKNDQACIQSCGGTATAPPATAGDFYTGLQSTQMYDARNQFGF